MKETLQQRIPLPLLFYEILLTRKEHPFHEEHPYQRLYKGFTGERKLIDLLEDVDSKKIIPLYDCLFEVHQKEFQIDYLLLTSDTLFLLEVKNYTDDYYFKDDKFFNVQTNREIYNPLTQLARTEFLFKQLLQEMRVKIQVQAYIVFINRTFWLYNSPMQSPFIYPPQIKRFLTKIEQNASTITSFTQDLAERILQRKRYALIMKYFPKSN